MTRVFSGIQPTGNLHLGNYLGAIRHWVQLQEKPRIIENDGSAEGQREAAGDWGGKPPNQNKKAYECIYCVVDMHAITVPQEPEKLRNATREVAAALIASGVDPAKSILFPQSAVSAHAELAWILDCMTPLGWLNRMTQFKEKAGKKRDNAGLGLYAYPVLMAADILAYKATAVPVGDDQKQHLELARDIAGAFNRQYFGEEGTENGYFNLPEPLIMGEATRVMSLRDGTKKMSKSDASDMSRINLNDDTDTIAKKFKKAKSDMLEGITYDPENRPEASNLLRIYAALADQSLKETQSQFEGSNFAAFKKELTDLAVESLSPMTAKMRVLMDDPANIDSFLQAGAEKANDIAQKHLAEIKEIVGFLSFDASPFR